jgi:glycosyltransferase involved in cell wall biosynthesis
MNKSVQNRPLISVVIPLYCEGSNLRVVFSEIYRVLKSLDESYEIILIDDGSNDNTWSIIEEEAKKYTMLRAVRLSRNFGKESALCAGIEMTRGSAVITIDGDLQHPPELIPEMVRRWQELQADVIEAVKESRGRESFNDRIGAKMFYAILNKLSGYDLNGASDYKLMDRKVVDVWLRMGERNLFFRGMSAWMGFKRIRIPFVVPERFSGTSRWSVFCLIKLAITAVTAFSSLPLQIVTLSGGLFFLFALILCIQTFYNKIVGNAVSGFTTVILLQLIIGSLLMISLGIIGEYIAKIFEEVKGRPRYVVAELIDNTIKKLSE